jgi:hypothetical protein
MKIDYQIQLGLNSCEKNVDRFILTILYCQIRIRNAGGWGGIQLVPEIIMNPRMLTTVHYSP